MLLEEDMSALAKTMLDGDAGVTTLTLLEVDQYQYIFLDLDI